MRRAIFAAIPILLVNGVAIFGQFQFWHYTTGWSILAAILFSIALESVSVFLAYHAHLAQVSNDSALRLRWSSYGLGIVIGILNASHYLSPDGGLTAAAFGMGVMSAISPWLWAVHTRRQSRDKLVSQGLIDPHALRLGLARWLWHPRLSFRVMRAACWTGNNRPDEAIRLYGPETAPNKIDSDPGRVIPGSVSQAPERSLSAVDDTPRIAAPTGNGTGKLELPVKTDLSFMDNKAEAVRYALGLLGDNAKARDVSDWLAAHGQPDISPSYVRVTKGRLNRSTA